MKTEAIEQHEEPHGPRRGIGHAELFFTAYQVWNLRLIGRYTSGHDT
jgi:hypothetical protein